MKLEFHLSLNPPGPLAQMKGEVDRNSKLWFCFAMQFRFGPAIH